MPRLRSLPEPQRSSQVVLHPEAIPLVVGQPQLKAGLGIPGLGGLAQAVPAGARPLPVVLPSQPGKHQQGRGHEQQGQVVELGGARPEEGQGHAKPEHVQQDGPRQQQPTDGPVRQGPVRQCLEARHGFPARVDQGIRWGRVMPQQAVGEGREGAQTLRREGPLTRLGLVCGDPVAIMVGLGQPGRRRAKAQGRGSLVPGLRLGRFRRAALRGHPEAAFRLAEALRTGHGAPLPEQAEAETWYQRAAALGFGPAAAWLAQAYQDGDGVPADEAKAGAWALEAERLRPFLPLSHSLLRHDVAPADPLVHASGKAMAGVEELADRALAHRPLRWLLLTGAVLLPVLWLGVALTFFWAGSSQLHHLPLIFMTPPLLMITWLAWQHYRERPRTGRDRLREAAEAGDPDACYRLGLAYRQGDRPRMKDDLTAALWFRKAAEGGHIGAMAALAEAYLGGHGVLRDPREARRWSEAASRESTSQSEHPMEP